jgi:ferredoxin-thioredoxin reductase catalytic subunit
MDVCDITPKSVDVNEDSEVACHLYYEHDDDRMDLVDRAENGGETK